MKLAEVKKQVLNLIPGGDDLNAAKQFAAKHEFKVDFRTKSSWYETLAYARAESLAKQIKYLNVEVGYAINAKGEYLRMSQGDPSSIDLNPYKEELFFLNPIIFVHNHPSGNSLSTADMGVLFGLDLKTVWAVTNKELVYEFKSLVYNKYISEEFLYFHTTLYEKYQNVINLADLVGKEYHSKWQNKVGEDQVLCDSLSFMHLHMCWVRACANQPSNDRIVDYKMFLLD